MFQALPQLCPGLITHSCQPIWLVSPQTTSLAVSLLPLVAMPPASSWMRSLLARVLASWLWYQS